VSKLRAGSPVTHHSRRPSHHSGRVLGLLAALSILVLPAPAVAAIRAVAPATGVLTLPASPKLAADATAVSTPGNPQYRHFMPATATARLLPSASMLHAAARAIDAKGARASIHGHAVLVTGTAKLLARLDTSGVRVGGQAMHVQPVHTGPHGRYAAASLKIVRRVPVGSDPSIRATRLDGRLNASTDPAGPQPCAAISGIQAGLDEGWTADQIGSAYDLDPYYDAGDTGQGVTIALLELEPDLPKDIAAYQSCYGTSTTVNYTQVDGGNGTGPGVGEAALDIEQIIAQAPGATIDVYDAPDTTQGFLDAWQQMIDNPAVNIISDSWGRCESNVGSGLASIENTMFEQAATAGITVFAAAGDEGSDDCTDGNLGVDDPGSQPFVTSAGGTELSDYTDPASQTVWNTTSSSAGAGGGGLSEFWGLPSYQAGSVTSNLQVAGVCGDAAGCRQDPDLSADADPSTGYWIYLSGAGGEQSLNLIGGTSAAAPLMADIAALTYDSAACNQTALGFLNPLLYGVAGIPSDYAAAFTDITVGNNTNNQFGYTGTMWPALPGYDEASGLGAPIGFVLGNLLCAQADQVTWTLLPGQGATIGTPIPAVHLNATDNEGHPLTYTASGLPSGLSVTGQEITGTPTVAGDYTVRLTATAQTTGVASTQTIGWDVSSNGVVTPPAVTTPTVTQTTPTAPATTPPTTTTGTQTNAAQTNTTGAGPAPTSTATTGTLSTTATTTAPAQTSGTQTKPATPTTRPPSTPPTVTKTSRKPSVTVQHQAALGDRWLTLTTPKPTPCLAATRTLTATFRTGRYNVGSKYDYLGVTLTLGQGVRHVRQAHKRGRDVKLVTFTPNITSHRTSVAARLPLKGLKTGAHTIRAVASFRHGRKITTQTLASEVRVCSPGPLVP
jgi:hypothetical protein